MQKISKFRIILISFIIVFFVGFCFLSLPLIARADDTEYKLTGQVYLVSGDSDFYPAYSAENRVIVNCVDFTDSNKIYGYGYLSSIGQYVINFTELPASTSTVLTFNIIDEAFSLSVSDRYIYMYNSKAQYITFGDLVSGGNYLDLYFRFFPLDRSISLPIYNYVYNSIYLDSGVTAVYDSRVYSPGNDRTLYNDMYFSGDFKFTNFVGTYPAFWFNFLGVGDTGLAGFGILAVKSTPTDPYPWKVYIKDNVTQRQVLIYQSDSSSISDIPTIHFSYRTSKTNANSSTMDIDIYYTMGKASQNIEGIISKALSLTVDSNIYSLHLQTNNLVGNFTNYTFEYGVSRSISEAWYTDVYEDGYKQGNTIGYNQGYNAGYAAGTEGQKYTFFSLISSVFNVPVQTLIDLLDVEILGTNMKTFFFSIVSVFLVIAVIRFLSGKLGGQDG